MEELFTSDIIDKDSAIPLYYQLYSYIEELIDSEKLKNGDRLPTEDELMKILGISRPTIRQAYKELESREYIRRQRSKGTVVTKPQVYGQFLNKLSSFRNELERRGDEVTTKVLAFKQVENHETPSDVLKTNNLIYLNRVRYSGNVPISFIETYLVYDKCKDILNYDLEKDSLYMRMNEIGCEVTHVQRVIGAEQPNKDVMKWLKMSTKEVVLISRTTGYLADGSVVEYTLDRYNGTVSNFLVEIEQTENP